MFQAAAEGNLVRVEELLAQGGLDLAAFEPNLKITALFRASNGGQLDVAKTIIRAGAPLSVPDESWSPLHGAVMGSHYDVAAMLLREGAKVDLRDLRDRTPLSCANERRMAAFLIAAGADVNAGPLGPLHVAANHGRLVVLAELLSHPGIIINKQDEKSHRTPLHFAAHYRHPGCVAALLAAGADASITDDGGRTPLLFGLASHRYYSEFRIIAVLVAAGDRQWPPIPTPCPGLESALLSVWKAAPQELEQLAARLTPEVKRRIRAALCTLHHASPRHLPEAIRMRLLDEAFNA